MRTLPRAAVSLLLMLPVLLEAQGTTTLRGVAYDSVASRPLGAALVTLNGIRSTFSDSAGSFAFDSVAEGVHQLEMTHAVLDSMGLPGVALRVPLTRASELITIAIPSFATLWRAACGDRPAPADSALVYGAIRSAVDGQQVGGAAIELSWTDFTLVNTKLVTGKRYRSETESDARGEYSVCGVPIDAGLRVQASADGVASVPIDVMGASLRVVRRDLMMGPVDTSAVTVRGSVVGHVMRSAGGPLEGATIVLDDVPLTKSAADGRFFLPGIVPGTHQIEVLSVGLAPELLLVDVIGGSQAEVAVAMTQVTTLQAVRIVGSRWQVRLLEAMEARKKQGMGKFMDSTQIGKRGTIAAVMSGQPSVDVRYRRGGHLLLLLPGRRGGQCPANLLIDGLQSDTEMLTALVPEDIAVVEVYARSFTVPLELMRGNSECGTIAVWTKRMVR